LDDVGCHDGRMDQTTTAGGNSKSDIIQLASAQLLTIHLLMNKDLSVDEYLYGTPITEINHG
jgi:hypothetical protein